MEGPDKARRRDDKAEGSADGKGTEQNETREAERSLKVIRDSASRVRCSVWVDRLLGPRVSPIIMSPTDLSSLQMMTSKYLLSIIAFI